MLERFKEQNIVSDFDTVCGTVKLSRNESQINAIEVLPYNIDLPAIQKFSPPGVSTFYGAHAVAASYCGFGDTALYPRGHWQHGWTPAHFQIYPEMLMGSSTSAKEDYYWVARIDEEVYLKNSGYKNVKAIGLPMVYVPDIEVSRLPLSLLVMPAHSLEYTSHNWKFDEYAEHIDSIRHHFSQVVICVHPSCWERGYWVSSFKRKGFEVIRGASIDDQNGLKRMYTMLSSFEYVTTNAFGSHLVYAAYCGAKASIYGDYAEYQARDYANAPFYRENPRALEPTIEAVSERVIRQHYPDLFCPPLQATEKLEWARKEMGHENRLKPREMQRLFRWRVRDGVAGKIKSALPPRLKHWTKLALKPQYRSRRNEFYRLQRIPNHTRTQTQLLGVPFEIVDAESFLFTYDEIFEREIYRFKSTNSSPYIIDGGANVGISVVYFKHLFPDCRITAFEPDPDIFQVLSANCERFGFRHVQLIRKALWTDDTVLQFTQEGAEAGRVSKTGDPDTIIDVPACRLKHFLDRPVDLLKLDIEGAETEVLLDCADELRNVEKLFVEYHSFAHETQTLNLIVSVLTDAGFRLHFHPVGVSPQPFVSRPVRMGMDMQLNIFGVR
ncbi:MAG TPA: FkbM family methyltransferase [Pyrinomonadaceae bacterium]|nr:FkbM family methyltransferase [Pyrinomonadaceae bacterium]